MSFNTPRKDANGGWIFYSVPPGAYTLQARAAGAGPPDTPNYRDYTASVPVTVNGDVEGLRIAVSAPTDVAGTVRVEGQDKANLAGLDIHFDSRGGFGADAVVAADHSFTTGAHAGHYQVYVGENPGGWIVKSIRSESMDVLRDGLTVFETGKAALDIVLTADGGKADGVALDKDDKPVAGATVLLIAEAKLPGRYDSFHSATTDQYGRYHFENIRPGDYKLFAWDDIEPNSWFDAEVMKRFEDKGEAVTIHDKGQETSKLHLISTEQK